MSAGGVLSGVPAAAVMTNFTVTATDTNGCAGTRAYILMMVNGPVVLHMKPTPPCAEPFKIFVTGSNLQNGIRVYIDGVEWYSVAWKNTGKIVLKGAIHAAVHPGSTHTFRFVNPDGGEFTKTWRYVQSLEACGS